MGMKKLIILKMTNLQYSDILSTRFKRYLTVRKPPKFIKTGLFGAGLRKIQLIILKVVKRMIRAGKNYTCILRKKRKEYANTSLYFLTIKAIKYGGFET